MRFFASVFLLAAASAAGQFVVSAAEVRTVPNEKAKKHREKVNKRYEATRCNPSTPHWDDFERIYPCQDVPLRFCNETTTQEVDVDGDVNSKSADHRCIIRPARSPDIEGFIQYDLFSNAVDLLALSQYIYEIVSLRSMMEDGIVEDDPRLTNITLDDPISFKDIQSVITDHLTDLWEGKNDAKLIEATTMLSEYFAPENEYVAGDTLNDRLLVKVGDDSFHKKASSVYAITINHTKKRVNVVFRGTSQIGDWNANLNALWKRNIQNPIKEMEATLPKIDLHRGFAYAILGDPKTTKPGEEVYRTIVAEVKSIMPDGYHLYVTGHRYVVL
jgi:hypothetical protein